MVEGAEQSTPAAADTAPLPSGGALHPCFDPGTHGLAALAASRVSCHGGWWGRALRAWLSGSNAAVCCERPSLRFPHSPTPCLLLRPEYKLLSKKGEGTFSEVLKATCIKNGKPVAIKCMKNHFDSLDQVCVRPSRMPGGPPLTARPCPQVNNLREIQALHRLSPHPNIIRLLEVLYDQPTGRLALVFELMDMNVYELIRGRRHYVPEDRTTVYMYQLMKSIDHMHRNGIFHRDIKPENILLCDDILKLADFGSCRGIYSKQPYTEYISTRWYRAPECLLTDGYYNHKMDMWGIGCVFFEVVSLFPLFPGTNELDQVAKIHAIIGTPSPDLLAKFKQRSAHMDLNFPPKQGTGIAKLIPHASPECIDLIQRLLEYDPDARLSARAALKHPYFRELREQDKRMQAQLMAQQSPEQQPGGGGYSGGDDGSPGQAQQAPQAAQAAASHGGGYHPSQQQQQQQQQHQQQYAGGSAGQHQYAAAPALHSERSTQQLHAEASTSSLRRGAVPHRMAATLPPARKAAPAAGPVQQPMALRGHAAPVGGPPPPPPPHGHAGPPKPVGPPRAGGPQMARSGQGPVAAGIATMPRYTGGVPPPQQQQQMPPLRREGSRTKLSGAPTMPVHSTSRAAGHARQGNTYVSPYSQRAIAASKHNE